MKQRLVGLFRWLILPAFFQPGFTYENCDHLQGWLSRDGYTDDWILWSPTTEQMYRKKDQPGAMWRASPESKNACLKLGRVYAELIGMKIR